MDNRKILRMLAALAVVLLVVYLYGQEVLRNWDALRNHRLSLHPGYLAASLLLCILSSLSETHIWQVSINRHLERGGLGLSESVAVMNGSGLLKYLPGRVWIYSAQLIWLKKYGIAKSRILYANLICILASLTVSLYLGLCYLLLYPGSWDRRIVALGLVALLLLNAAYILWNPAVLNLLIRLVNRWFKKGIEPLPNSVPLLLYIQLLYVVSWLLAGASGYFSLRGIGLDVPPGSLFALLASMSLSWLVGYLSVLAPGGFGVREATMLVMLNRVVDLPTALIFPVLTRVILLVAEMLLGLCALYYGLRHGIFTAAAGENQVSSPTGEPSDCKGGCDV